jgi:hypothetical protein
MFPKILVSHAEAISGDIPSSRQGPMSISSQASRSFGRLISESKLPASASSERLFVLDASSSTSPARGSMSGFIAGRPSALGNVLSSTAMHQEV